MYPSSLEDAFSQLEAPRREPEQLHKLLDIVMIAICAVISIALTSPMDEKPLL